MKPKILTLTLLAAAAATGCSREAEVKRCLDQNDRMAADLSCDQPPTSQPPGSTRYAPFVHPMYRWVYGGNGGYRPGDTVTGFGLQPTPGMESVRAGEL